MLARSSRLPFRTDKGSSSSARMRSTRSSSAQVANSSGTRFVAMWRSRNSGSMTLPQASGKVRAASSARAWASSAVALRRRTGTGWSAPAGTAHPRRARSARSSRSRPAGSRARIMSGRRSTVRVRAWSRLVRAIRPWSPESRTGSTSRSRHRVGRVWTGYSSRPATPWDSSTSDSGLPRTPGRSRAMASIMTMVATSPPLST